MEHIEQHGCNIAVLDKGFVYIGFVTERGDWFEITSAYNIRRWGTTRGLGELVGGPTENTVLDKVGTVKAPRHALVHLIHVDEAAWKNVLAG